MRDSRCRAIVTLLLLWLPGLAVAAEEAKPSASFQVEVNLVVIDVVVTDKDGNHVRGLAKDDFELYDDGDLQEVTEFSEEGLPLTREAQTARDVKAAVEPKVEEELDGRWFVLFFDESNMRASELDRARKAARDFVRYQIFPKDRVAVLRYGASLKLVQDFTGDVDALAKALYDEGTTGQRAGEAGLSAVGLEPASSGAGAVAAADPAGQDGLIRFQDEPDFEAIERAQSADRLYRTLSLVGKTLVRVKGRKTLVFFSRGFDAVFADHGLFKSYRDMVDTLNGANVAIYTLDAGGLAGKTPGAADVAPSRPLRPSGLAGEVRPMQRTPTDSARRLAGEQLSSLKVLATDTGGRALSGSNNIGKQLEEMAYSTSSYYLLGYTPRARAEGYRDIKVKVKRDGTRVLARKGYRAAQAFASLKKSDRSRHLEDALLSWEDIHDLPIAMRTEMYPLAPEQCVMGVELAVPRGLLTVDGQGAKVEVMMYLREDGGKVESFREEVLLSAAEALRELRYVKALAVKPGTFWLRAAVRDNVGGALGTASAKLTVPAFDDDRPMLSTLVLMTPSDGTTLVTSKDGPATAAASFRVAGRQFYPSPENAFPAVGEVLCFFRVGNLKLDEATGLPRLTVMYTVWRGGEPVSQQTVHYRANEKPDPAEGIPIHVRLPVEGLGVGSYRLEVSAYDILAAKGIKSEVAFQVTPRSPEAGAEPPPATAEPPPSSERL